MTRVTLHVTYIIIIAFWRETSPKSLPPGNRGSTQNIRWFLKTHYNHQLKINITAKRSYQIKIIKVFGGAGLWVGGDTGRIFLFELKYSVMGFSKSHNRTPIMALGFRNTGFN